MTLSLHRHPGDDFQGLLFWGVWPGVGWNNNKGEKAPFGTEWLDYAPLFAAMRGKLWVAEPHAVSPLEPSSAYVNIFAIEGTGNYTLVAAYGTPNATITVVLRGLPPFQSSAQVLHPGGRATVEATVLEKGSTEQWVVMRLSAAGGGSHGCAVVTMTPKTSGVDVPHSGLRENYPNGTLMWKTKVCCSYY